MLYLYRSFGRNNLSILKVGFTDSETTDRYTCYYHHNPLIEVVAEREGDWITEQMLHHYLKSLGLKYPKLNEWYIDSPETIENFNIPLEELERFIWNNRSDLFSIEELRGKESIGKIIEHLLERGPDLINDYEPEDFVYEDGVLKALQFNPFDKAYKDIYVLRDLSSDSEEELEVIKHLREYNNFHDQFKEFCQLAPFSEDIRDLVYSRFPKMAYYYENLGFENCRAMRYNEKDLRIRLSDVKALSSDSLSDIIAERIKPGNYSRNYLKELLKEIFEELGIKKGATASFLSGYYNLSKNKVKNPETGKWEHGFRLEPLDK